jgi:hypothetical protein
VLQAEAEHPRATFPMRRRRRGCLCNHKSICIFCAPMQLQTFLDGCVCRHEKKNTLTFFKFTYSFSSWICLCEMLIWYRKQYAAGSSRPSISQQNPRGGGVRLCVCTCATNWPMLPRGHHAVLRAEALEW